MAAQLQARGFAIVDDVFGGKAATELRQELEALRQVLRHHAVLQEGVRADTNGLVLEAA